MSLSLSLTRGPLEDEALDAIAATYGTVDPRYAARGFCREVFNGNPFGYSYHAFVRDHDTVVGHYAVVPVRARARSANVISGKGEALFLAESHRRNWIETAAGEMPAGIALMNSLHEHALAKGVAVLHNYTSPEIGMVQRMYGFRVLKVPLDQLHFLISPSELRQLGHSGLRALAARLLGGGQNALLAAARTGLRLKDAPGVEVNPVAHAEAHLAALAATEVAGGAVWTISRDLDTLRWLMRLGRLEVVSVAGNPNHFAIMVKDNVRELVLWNVPASERGSGLGIACALVSRSVAERAWILSVKRRLAAEGGASLGFALRMLGFVPQRILVTIYAKSADDFYLQSANLDFTRMFHL